MSLWPSSFGFKPKGEETIAFSSSLTVCRNKDETTLQNAKNLSLVGIYVDVKSSEYVKDRSSNKRGGCVHQDRKD